VYDGPRFLPGVLFCPEATEINNQPNFVDYADEFSTGRTTAGLVCHVENWLLKVSDNGG
jgi:hypothetical protein